ncbi:hypothetical protein [Amycolatopsis lexingtonensis]|uniref:hypothetical protein n=1 Tax=Amycolatopsis lexingtonensis TaxID=218822 RepID=UPI003F72DA56
MAEARIETLGGSGARLAPRQDHPLHDGDRLEFGPVAAVYSDGEGGAPQTRSWWC